MRAIIFLTIALCFLALTSHAVTLDSARVLLDNGWVNKAMDILKPIVESDEDNAEALYLLGRSYLVLDDHDQAEKYLKRAKELDTTRYEYFLSYGNAIGLKAARGSKLKAPFRARSCRDAYERACALAPDSIGPRIALVEFHTQAPGVAGGDKDKARAQLDTIFMIDSAAGYMLRAGLLEFQEQDTAKAELEYLRAVQVDTTRRESLYRLAGYYQRHEFHDKAEPVYQRILRLDSSEVAARMQLGFIYQAQSRFGEAFEQFGTVLTMDSTELGALYQIGRTAVLSGTELPMGEKAFHRYLQAELKPAWPGRASAHWRLAMLYDLQGRTDDAVQEVDRALELNPRHPEGLELKAQLEH